MCLRLANENLVLFFRCNFDLAEVDLTVAVLVILRAIEVIQVWRRVRHLQQLLWGPLRIVLSWCTRTLPFLILLHLRLSLDQFIIILQPLALKYLLESQRRR